MIDFDEDAVAAVIDLVGRTGATGLQFGCLHEDRPVHEADWWAHAQFKGSRITVEHHAGPQEALDALARRLLTGALCRCGRLVALSDVGAFAYNSATLADGRQLTAEEAAQLGQCRWRRVGPRWHRGCESRADRRAQKRKRKTT